jgi:hypothetical protein
MENGGLAVAPSHRKRAGRSRLAEAAPQAGSRTEAGPIGGSARNLPAGFGVSRTARAPPPANRIGDSHMPIVLFVILVLMIAQLGFWDTFSAILGGVAMLALFVLLVIALVAVGVMLILRRVRG